MHRATRRFWKYFDDLPETVQTIAKRNLESLKKDPSHPSLHFKKVGKFWSARVGIIHRALRWKMVQISFGYGSVPTTNTSD